MRREQAEELMATLVGASYPNAIPVREDHRRFVRSWVVRSRLEIPDQSILGPLAEKLAAEAGNVVREASGRHVPEEAISTSLPAASIVRVAPHHCIVCIESPTPEHALGNDAAIGTWTILRGLDAAFGIEDLQGIPKEFWFALK